MKISAEEATAALNLTGTIVSAALELYAKNRAIAEAAGATPDDLAAADARFLVNYPDPLKA